MDEQMSLERIARHISNMEPKKTFLFGFDRTDVYQQIMELDNLYQGYIRGLTKRLEELEAVSQDRERDREDARRASLRMQSAQKLLEEKESELIKLRQECQRLRQESEQQSTLHTTAGGVPMPNWEDVQAILREAEEERRQIVESARLEAQQERLRMMAKQRQELAQLEAEKGNLLQMLQSVDRELQGMTMTVDGLKEKLGSPHGEPDTEEITGGSLLTIKR